MVFEGLGQKLQETMRKLRGRGKLSEGDVDAALREVRLALLEADVNFKVARKFVNRIRERAVGGEVMQSLTPGQQVVKIVHEELTQLMGGRQRSLVFSSQPPTVIILAGLQGSGKTTGCAKLARHLQGRGRHPLLVAADVYRPAAVDQLQQLGAQIEVPVVHMDGRPEDIARAGYSQAKKTGRDTVIIDTAGRLHIDEDMMDELERITDSVEVHEALLVVDAMTGQDAVNVAQEFSARIDITGVFLTKLDGDTRGGAALSVLDVTGCPIKFAGVGEKLQDLEAFHPDRMASRILGMGDVLTLIEKAEEKFDRDSAAKMEKTLREGRFTLEDFLEQLQQVKEMGPLDQLMSMIPGMGKQGMPMGEVDEGELVKIEAIIQSMTPEERKSPEIVKRSRRRRIARGSGTRVQDVNRLLKQFNQMQMLFRQLSGGGRGKLPKKLRGIVPPFAE
ncbi:MAG: signal recognition particle protein [Bacillota bacterium]